VSGRYRYTPNLRSARPVERKNLNDQQRVLPNLDPVGVVDDSRTCDLALTFSVGPKRKRNPKCTPFPQALSYGSLCEQ